MLHKVVRKQETKRTVDERVSALRSLSKIDDGSPANEVKRSLVDPSPTVRAAAVDVVRTKGLFEFESSVRLLLSDKNRSVRYTAVECLGTLYAGQSVSASWLYPLLSDSNHLVRIETLESLGSIGDRKALPLIAAKLEDDDPLVRSYAARLIAELEGKKYIKALVGRTKIEQNETALVGLAYALFELGDVKQLAVLLKLLSSDDYRVRCASANSLSVANLTSAQRETVLLAISNAAHHALAVADRSTMERVEKELRD